MFGHYLGNYLVEKNKISRSDLEEVLALQSNARAKLGTIAVSEKLLTAKQADEINNLQKKMDKRFGDIAIEKGYLLEEEVTHLLNLQGNPYLRFVQALTDQGTMTMETIESNLEGFKKEYQLSDSELDSLKSGDIDRIISVFVESDNTYAQDSIGLVLRNVVRFISNQFIIKKSYRVNEYSFGNLACQTMIGDEQIFVGLASKDKELLHIAEPFAKETFAEVDDDAFDSVCEFINCSNGLYASKLSLEDINIDMTPPFFYKNKAIKSQGDIYVVPFVINGAQIDLLVIVNNQVEIN